MIIRHNNNSLIHSNQKRSKDQKRKIIRNLINRMDRIMRIWNRIK